MTTISFPLIDLAPEGEEPELWAIIDADWVPQKKDSDLPADEYLWSLRLRRGGEEKYLKVSQEDMSRFTDPERNPYREFALVEEE
jgi:hypothetical protein